MPELDVPERPPLVTIPAVPIVSVGTWDLSTGRTTFTKEHLADAVAAVADPAIRTPILKIGHVDPRFDGEPAVGRIENLRLSADKLTVLGDYTGVPAWLADTMASAYPSRSMEGDWNVTTVGGRTYSMVITAVALLGVQSPGITTLGDIADLFGVAASLQQADLAGDPFAVVLPAADPEEPPVPPDIAAAVNVDAIREAFYEVAPRNSWAWVREVYAGEGAFIVVDDDEGSLWRVPWSEGEGGTVVFGDAERVAVTYVPAPDDDAGPLVLAARFRPVGGQPIAASSPNPTGGRMDPVQLRTSLGLAETASDEEVLARAAELQAAASAAAETPPTAPPALPEGVVVIDEGELATLRASAAEGADARRRQREEDRDRALDAAIAAGKFPPARRAHWSSLWDRDPDGTRDFIDKTLAAGTVPVSEIGHAGAGDKTADDELYELVYGAEQKGA
jgi:hypothetical protein